jgi:hypothetical protein
MGVTQQNDAKSENEDYYLGNAVTGLFGNSHDQSPQSLEI